MEGGGSGGGDAAGTVATAGGGSAGLGANAPPPFLSKTYDMVDDPATDAIISWGPVNNSFVVWNPPEFARDLLPKYFKHNNFSSFVRQLNTYGFRKVDPDRWEFANEGFLRGQKHLLKNISRRKPSQIHNPPPQPQPQNTSVGPCVEVGKFGIEEEIDRLKRDKNVLMQELIKLRQQQQTTDHQLQTLGQRLQGMEQRQQQMMSFLAKAMQSPGFLAQLVQQNDSSRRIAAANKKRRLPKGDGIMEGEHASSDGQIVKYQPLMNEAAKAMLRQILKMDTSPRLDHITQSDGFLLDTVPSPSDALDSGISPVCSSGSTITGVPQSSSISYLTANLGLTTIPPSAAISEIQSPRVTTEMVTTTNLPDTGVLPGVPDHMPCQADMAIPEIIPTQGLVHENHVGVPTVSEAGDVCPDQILIGVDDTVPSDDIDIFIDDSSRLPEINDSFWEQFLTVSSLSGDISGDMEEVESTAQAPKDLQLDQGSAWDKTQKMDHLTEQMGLLSSQSKE
ncbi:hypothetical protein Taro_044476 [Colocasia esculenta]|uniref:HSF-type DNA-binding domain-containing protein n=1 Tax=Colocasia esculenta TaxID=4460 RepID=A0A843X3D4_COLES|nr:hypothetical protein [Colocasia esculenta]